MRILGASSAARLPRQVNLIPELILQWWEHSVELLRAAVRFLYLITALLHDEEQGMSCPVLSIWLLCPMPSSEFLRGDFCEPGPLGPD